jgi:hypothetical protein
VVGLESPQGIRVHLAVSSDRDLVAVLLVISLFLLGGLASCLAVGIDGLGSAFSYIQLYRVKLAFMPKADAPNRRNESEAGHCLPFAMS